MSVVELNGEEVLKVERNFEKTPFDINNLEAMVDKATIIKLKGLDLENGVIELKVITK